MPIKVLALKKVTWVSCCQLKKFVNILVKKKMKIAGDILNDNVTL